MLGDALVAIIHTDWSYAMATFGFCSFPIRSHFLIMYSDDSSVRCISGEFVFWTVGAAVAIFGVDCNGGVGTVAVDLWVGGRSPIGDTGRLVKDIAGAGRGVKGCSLFSTLVSVFSCFWGSGFGAG